MMYVAGGRETVSELVRRESRCEKSTGRVGSGVSRGGRRQTRERRVSEMPIGEGC
jgi:hypothetical protein